ncbi:MAG: ROK family protein, partial [Lachnospiraceae bacterium]|nr:ROK family protein [Lachnospiraceae bacterium]
MKSITTTDITQLLTHPFEPLFDAESRILILGSFPSVKSREQNFFYGHPQNRFWKVLANVFADSGNASGRGADTNAHASAASASAEPASAALSNHVFVPQTIEEKRDFLLGHHVALWDVIYSCRIHGSSDASIRDAVPTDLRRIIGNSKVDRIFVNGQMVYGHDGFAGELGHATLIVGGRPCTCGRRGCL